MVATATDPQTADDKPPSQPGSQTFSLLTIAAVASLAAGAIHATAAGTHSADRQAVIAFVAVAVFQLGWGALALLRADRLVALLGAAGNAAAFGGWVMAKTDGISFVDGLEGSESVQFSDGLAAGLAATAVLAALGAIVLPAGIRFAPVAGQALTGMVVVAGIALAVPGMVETGGHAHGGGGHSEGGEDGHSDGGHGEEAADGHEGMEHDETEGSAAGESEEGHGEHASEGQPFDPALPIDLGGTEGVTPQQQAAAENMLALNLARLPQWADTASAEAAGFHSIGDALTGEEHYINWNWINDDKTLDPDYPESLVYRVDRDGTRTLEAAMYMLPQGSTLETVPNVGGALMQWHIHNDLCFTTDPVAPKVAGVTDAEEPCSDGLQRLIPVPMIHIWIVPNDCGPFAALQGVGAGQIQEGEERLCDHAHGSGL